MRSAPANAEPQPAIDAPAIAGGQRSSPVVATRVVVRPMTTAAEPGIATPGPMPRIALIVHRDEPLNHDTLPRWLSRSVAVVAIIVIDEARSTRLRRLRAEYRRVGFWRLLDVLAYRIWYRLFSAPADAAWVQQQVDLFRQRFPIDVAAIPTLSTAEPRGERVSDFLRTNRPDLVIARCKWLLRKDLYDIPRFGTYVLHPGICPQYRNAHGCFWAIASDDMRNVGLTLLRIDDGIDTGPIYGFYRYPFDAQRETHIRIQEKVVLENTEAIAAKLIDIAKQRAQPLAIGPAASRNWGQPWLSSYLGIRRRLGSRPA